jgi:hypothetical protein
MTTRQLVIEVPISTCIRCNTEGEGAVQHIYGSSSARGGVEAYVDPPPGWVRLAHCDRLPDGKAPRQFDICGSCYELGPENGSRVARATFEART